ncbi:tryptophan--tRNA ligase, partial [Stenotrophomonas maltophilia]
RIDSELSPLRERYTALMAEPEKSEALLTRRGQQLREQLAAPLLDELRHAVGRRDLSSAGDIASEDAGVARVAPPQ